MNFENIQEVPIELLEGNPKEFDLTYYKMPDERFDEIVTGLYDKELETVQVTEQVTEQVEQIYDHDAINDLSNVSEIMNDETYAELFDVNNDILTDEILFDTMALRTNPINYVDGYKMTARNVFSSRDLYTRDERFDQNDLLGLTAKQAMHMLNFNSLHSLLRLVDKGLIRTFKVGANRRYSTSDIHRILNKQNKNKIIAVYARVWDVSQTRSVDSLKGQIKKLLNFATEKRLPVKRIYRDTSFALDYTMYTRKGLHALIYDVIRGRVDVVLIESPDRLGMAGYELLVQLFKYFKTKIIFMSDTTSNVQYRNEMIGEFAFLQKLLHKSVNQGKIVNTDVDLSKINYREILSI